MARRTRELGVRLALGAQRSHILRLILNRGLVLSTAGLVLGISASLVLTRYIASLLFATSAVDQLTFATVTVILLAVSILSLAREKVVTGRSPSNENRKPPTVGWAFTISLAGSDRGTSWRSLFLVRCAIRFHERVDAAQAGGGEAQ